MRTILLLGISLALAGCARQDRTASNDYDRSAEQQKDAIESTADAQKEQVDAQARAAKDAVEAQKESAEAAAKAERERLDDAAGAQVNARLDTDDDFSLKLRNSLGLDNDRDVKIKIENGEVTLTGNVRSEEERRNLEAKARAFPGVTKVNNKLDVNP